MYPKQPADLADLTWTEVAALDPEGTAVFVVSGPIEQHGPRSA